MPDVTITQLMISLLVERRDFQWEEIEPQLGDVPYTWCRDEAIREIYGERAIALYFPELVVILFEGGNCWLQVQHVFQLVR